MAKLVTLERAKQQLRDLDEGRDDEVEALIEEATDAVLDYLELRGNPREWTTETVPAEIRRAILLELGAADVNRGDDPQGAQPLGEGTRALLRRWRDPVLA